VSGPGGQVTGEMARGQSSWSNSCWCPGPDEGRIVGKSLSSKAVGEK
jgi:hypothetical protein